MLSRDDDCALISGDRYLSHPALDERARQVATALHDLGIGQGDRITLLLRNDVVYFEATRGAALLGASTVPLNWHLTADEISYVLEDCDAKLVVAHADILTDAVLAACGEIPAIGVAVPPEVATAYDVVDTSIPVGVKEWSIWVDGYGPWPDPPLAPTGPMFYTSGTTGKPKGVRRGSVPPDVAKTGEQRSLLAWGLATPEVRSVMTGPLYHSAPNAYGMAVLRGGGCLVLQPRFDAEQLLITIEQQAITHLHLVPTMFVRLLALPAAVRTRYHISSLVHVSHGAAPCPADVKRRMIEWWGPVIVEYYAMTETGVIAIGDSSEWTDNPGTVGRAAPGVDIRILGERGEILGPAQVGEICVRTALTSFITYHRAEEKTAAMRRGDFVATGDIGYLNEDGFLFISDRKSDMVISGGVNIYPAEIEGVLVGFPGVRDCAVFGVPDSEFGERLVAMVETPKPLVSADIQKYLKTKLAGYKVPREFNCVASLPREESGKIKKRLLRDQYLQEGQ